LARYTFHARDGMARWVGLGVIAKTSPLRSVVGRARPSAPSWPALTGLAAMRRPWTSGTKRSRRQPTAGATRACHPRCTVRH